MTTGNTTTTGAELAPRMAAVALAKGCLLYTSDAADE